MESDCLTRQMYDILSNIEDISSNVKRITTTMSDLANSLSKLDQKLDEMMKNSKGGCKECENSLM